MSQSISVLMPALNASSTIRLAVKSTLRALRSSDELLVFLDGCTDKSSEVLKRINDPRLRILESEIQVGVANALNTLLSQASNPLVARMDADDFCLPWRFSDQLRILKSTGADLVFSSHIFFGWSLFPPVRPSVWCSLSPEESTLALLISNPFAHPGLLAHRQVIESLGGYRESPAEDYDLWLRANLMKYKIVRGAIPGVCMRVHSSQITQNALWQSKLLGDPLLKESLSRARREFFSQRFSGDTRTQIRAGGQLSQALQAHMTKQRYLVRLLLGRNLKKVERTEDE